MRGSSRNRCIDHLFGSAILWMVGLVKPKKRKPATIRTIAILQTAAIGDTVLMSGPIADLRAAHPQAKIIICCGKQNRQAASMIEAADGVIELNVFNVLDAVKTIRNVKPDVIIDFGPWPRINAIISALSGAYSIGYQTIGQHRHYAYDATILHRSDCHEIENQRSLVRALGGKSLNVPSLTVDPDISVSHPQKPYVVIHMWASGSGKALKEWPEHYWREVVSYCAKNKRNIVLTGAEQDKAASDSFIKSVDEKWQSSIQSVAGSLSLSKTYLLLQQAELVISVNTGVLHMTAATNTPVIGLHGPTSITRWGPVGGNSIALSPKRGLQQYLNLGFEYHRRLPDCMGRIYPKEVIQQIDKLTNVA